MRHARVGETGPTIKSHWAGGAGSSIQQRWNDLKAIPTNGNRVISSHDAVCQAVFNPDGDGTVITTAEYMEGDCLILRPDGDTVEVLAQWCSENWSRYHVRFPDGITSVSERSTAHDAIHAYPNPATSTLRIATSTPTLVRIVDLYGRCHASVDLRGAHLEADVPVDGWPTGTYILLGSTSVGRVVVTR